MAEAGGPMGAEGYWDICIVARVWEVLGHHVPPSRLSDVPETTHPTPHFGCRGQCDFEDELAQYENRAGHTQVMGSPLYRPN